MQQLITMAANRATPRVQLARHDILQPGTHVIVQHVLAKLNGKVGRVCTFDDVKGRYDVQLEDQSGRAIALKPQNVDQI